MIRLVVFDAYGTLFDVYSVGEMAEALFPGKGSALSLLWRDKLPRLLQSRLDYPALRVIHVL